MPLPAIISRGTALVSRAASAVLAPLTRTTTGGAGGAFVLPTGGGLIPAGWPINYWQLGYDPLPPAPSSVVSACIAAYAQTTAMCPGSHWQSTGDGGRERVTTSALSRILKKPNGYQSISDFLLNAVTNLYEDGNAYALALRNQRFEISQLHLFNPRASGPAVAITGDIFYSLGGNPIVEAQFASMGIASLLSRIPARDVLHIRLECKRDPLLGESPMMSLLWEMAASNAWLRQQLELAKSNGRPGGVIETEKYFQTEQNVKDARARWNEAVANFDTPILTDGMKWKQATITSREGQLAELLQLNAQLIATRFRVPLPLLSLLSSQGPQGSTESLMQFWIATGLGFCLNHTEEAFGQTFGLAGWPDDYLEFDTSALLRSLFKDRIEALARGVQGGIYAPNEARASEELAAVAHGDEPRVQQQVVPLSAWAQAPPATPRPDAPPAAPTESDDNDDAERALAAFRRSHLAA